jgi:tetratricopeptide (TPR) repeat protein
VVRALARLSEIVDAPAGLAGAFAVAVWLAWAELAGGFFATRWGLLGAFLVAALAVTLATVRVDPSVRSPARAAMLGALAAFVAWNALSMLWADFPGEAWTGTAKTALYAASFGIFALWPWSTRGIRAVLAALALGAGVLGLASLLEAALSADPAEQLIDGRLVGPVEYVNGSVAVWMTGFWPALHVAVTPRGGVALRAACLGVAGLLASLCVLAGSRGWLFVLPLAAAVFVALARQRLRAVAGLVLVALATAAVFSMLVDVADRAEAGRPVGPALDRAAGATVAAGLALAAAGAAWALLEGRVRLAPRLHRALGVAVAALAAVALTAGGAGAAVAADDPRGWVSARWDDFKGGDFPVGRSRFEGSLGTNRYNEWVVALREFRDHPVQGIGSDNYAAAYLEQRPDEYYHPRYPHSWPLRLLSQLGVVGAALFLAAAGIAVALALGRRRRGDAVAGGAAAAALTVFAYWALHGSLDWFWEIPAAAAPAFGLLALAGSPEPRADGRRPPARVTRAGAALVAAPVCALLLVSWVSASYQGAGAAVWRDRPETAYVRLERAADLNPLSAEPLVVAGVIATRRAEYDRAQDLFERAAGREPENWYVHLQLGLLAAERGDYAAAGRLLARAAGLNPLDSRVRHASGLVRRRAAVDPRAVNARFAPAEEPRARGLRNG